MDTTTDLKNSQEKPKIAQYTSSCTTSSALTSGVIGTALGTPGTSLNSVFNQWVNPVSQEEDVNLKKISDTCKLFKLEKYDPARFIGQLKELQSLIHSAAMASTGQISAYKCLGIDPIQKADALIGRMLLSFDKETTSETIEKACNENP